MNLGPLLDESKQKISKQQALDRCEQLRKSLIGDMKMLQDLGLAYPEVTRTPIFRKSVTEKGLQRC